MRTLFAVAVITATILASGCVLAAGAMRLPPTHVIAAIPLLIPRSLPDVSVRTVLAGCGGHRQFDPRTEKCRGQGISESDCLSRGYWPLIHVKTVRETVA